MSAAGPVAARRPILVGYDPRRADHAPVEFGVELARLTGARLLIASVEAEAPVLPMDPLAGEPYPSVHTTDPDLLEDCTPALRDMETHLDEPGIAYECIKLEGTSAPRAMHEEAERDGAAMIVVGSSRRSRSGRTLTGSTAERLLHGAPCPVDVVPRDWTRPRTLSTIGVAYVDSDDAREAVRAAWALASRAGAALRAFTVVRGADLSDLQGEYRLRALDALRRVVEDLDREVAVRTEALVGDPAEVLIDVSRGLDLLVLGSRGYGPLRAVLLGSVSARVAAEAHCPVSVLPRGVRAPLDALLGTATGSAARLAR
jgi:nucleotide-binding universal stress UspA family protein